MGAQLRELGCQQRPMRSPAENEESTLNCRHLLPDHVPAVEAHPPPNQSPRRLPATECVPRVVCTKIERANISEHQHGQYQLRRVIQRDKANTATKCMACYTFVDCTGLWLRDRSSHAFDEYGQTKELNIESSTVFNVTTTTTELLAGIRSCPRTVATGHTSHD